MSAAGVIVPGLAEEAAPPQAHNPSASPTPSAIAVGPAPVDRLTMPPTMPIAYLRR
jgi:hypothetical protein